MRVTAALLGVALLTGHGAPEPGVQQAALRPAGPIAARGASDDDATARFLAAARGADPVMCSLAAAPVGNGWGRTGAPAADDAPATSLVRWALKPSIDDRDLTILEGGLRGDDDCVRTMAARLLAATEGGTAALLDGLDHADAAVRRAAAEGLGYAESRRASARLTQRLEDDADAGVRAAAAWALGLIEDPTAEAALGRALHDDASFVRLAAVDALGSLELQSSIDLLLPMLNDDDPRIRVATAHALGSLD